MKTISAPLNILVIEDNPGDFYLIDAMLRSSGVNIKTIYQATRLGEGCELLKQHSIDLILLDLSLPDSFGIDSFLKIKPVVKNIPVIILTGVTESEVAFEALQQGAQDYLVKGEFKSDLLVKSIQYSIERKSAEKKISVSEEKYRQMFYKNPFPAWIYDLESLLVLEVNDAAIETYGYTKDEFLALRKKDIQPEQEIHIKPTYRHLSGKKQEQERQCHHKKKNGDTIIAEATYSLISYSGKTAMQVLVKDLTEKLRLEKELMQQQKKKQQQIAEAIIRAQEEERKTLGAELHDNINQILATAKLYLTAALQDRASLVEFITKGQDCIVTAVEEIRMLSKKLTTPAFISTGLKRAIEDMIADICEVKDIKICTALDELESICLNETLKTAIYRIVQEQLNNILKYAEASEVTIRVTMRQDILTLLISDNGKGFDTRISNRGIGMINIQHRAELFNGRMEIDSSPGNGCRLKVELHVKGIPQQKAA